MSEDLKTFIERLIESQLITQEDLNGILNRPSGGKNTPEALAREVVAAGLLTKYQVRLIYHGKRDSVIMGQYVIQSPIGRGGMGTVFKAIHQKLKRPVAIKVLLPELVQSKEAVERFRREIVAAAEMRHPNIVQAYDAYQHNQTQFLVMELVAGQDLATRVKEKGPLSAKKAVEFLRQAACGLQYAHEKGVVHRDMKPHNLLVGAGDVVKVSDMGLARFRLEGDSRQSLTASGQVLGTADFMSPEQAQNAKTVDRRSDIYSLGCTLHYLLTGRAPFSAESYLAKLVAHSERAAPSLTEAASGIPQPLDEVFQRCMAKNPDDRYASMTELIADLDAILANGTLEDGAMIDPLDVLLGDSDSSGVDLGNADSGLPLPSRRSKTASRKRAASWFGLPMPLAIGAGGALAAVAVLLIIMLVSSQFTGESEIATPTDPGRETNTEQQVADPGGLSMTPLEHLPETTKSAVEPEPEPKPEPDAAPQEIRSVKDSLKRVLWDGDDFVPKYGRTIQVNPRVLGKNVMDGGFLRGIAFSPDGRIVISIGQGGAGDRRISYWSPNGGVEPAVPLEFVKDRIDVDYSKGRFDFFCGPIAYDKQGRCYFTFGQRRPDTLFCVDSLKPLQIRELTHFDDSKKRPGALVCPPFANDHLFYVNTFVPTVMSIDLNSPESPVQDYLKLQVDIPPHAQCGLNSVAFVSQDIALLSCRQSKSRERIEEVLLLDRTSHKFDIVQFGGEFFPTVYMRMALAPDGKRLVFNGQDIPGPPSFRMYNNHTLFECDMRDLGIDDGVATRE